MQQLNIKKVLLFTFILMLTITTYSQMQMRNKLTHHLSGEELLRKGEIGKDFTPTDPPEGEPRMFAEFERMQGALVAYPFGVPTSILKEIAEDCNLTTIVYNSGEQNYVTNLFESNGFNMDNVSFLVAETDSWWTRDYGPWYVVDGNNEVGICNFPYNRPRPNDNDIPIRMSEHLNIDLYGMNLIQTGGNYMCDGMGIAAQTDLVWEENPSLSHDDIEQLVEDYLGVHTLHVLPDPLDDYIKHIDCWGKFLDVDKVIIGQVPTSDYRYDDYEYVADYFANSISSFGTAYQVFRVYCPGGNPTTPYTNSLILNNKVFVPQSGSQWDDEALEVYEQAMPGYEVHGIYSSGWYNTDALHCRVKGIADIGKLHINHIPISGIAPINEGIEITADILAYSQQNIISDSVLCYYKINNEEYQSQIMNAGKGNIFTTTIPLQEAGTIISYYIHAADESGRSENHPLISIGDPHIFQVGDFVNLSVYPENLEYLTVNNCIEGLSFTIKNPTDIEINITSIEQESFEQGFHWYITPFTLEFPYLLAAGDSLVLDVFIDLPLNFTDNIINDTLNISSENMDFELVILFDEDLLIGITQYNLDKQSIKIYPNPVTDQLNIEFELITEENIQIQLFDLQGRLLNTLFEGVLHANKHKFNFDLRSSSQNKLRSGTYLIRINTATNNSQQQLLIVQ